MCAFFSVSFAQYLRNSWRINLRAGHIDCIFGTFGTLVRSIERNMRPIFTESVRLGLLVSQKKRKLTIVIYLKIPFIVFFCQCKVLQYNRLSSCDNDIA